MALPTADIRVETGPSSLFAKSRHLDPLLEDRLNRAGDFAAQVHELAGIRPVNGWDGAGATQFSPPSSTDQATLFLVTASKIITIKVLAFSAGRCFHKLTIGYK